jgi:signal transduction histidine kinase
VTVGLRLLPARVWDVARVIGAAAVLAATPATAPATPATSARAQAGAVGQHAQPQQRAIKQILVIFSDDPSQSWVRDLTDGFQAASAQRGDREPVWFFEYLDAVRFQDRGHGSRFLLAISEKYQDRRPDLVVAVASNAIALVAEARDEFWPDAPVLFANYGGTVPRDASGLRDASSVSFEYGFAQALATATTVFPGITSVVVSSGTSVVERVRESEVAADVRHAGLEFADLAAPSLTQALSLVARLPDRAMLFIAGGQVDASGRVIPTWQLCEAMSRAANRPTLMLGSQFLGCGIVGGLMRDYRKIGTIIADRAMTAASGATVRETVPFASIATLKFDARQLERWRVDEGRLPPGSIVLWRSPSLWREYRRAALIAMAALVAQSLLIGGLLLARRARQRAEIDSRHNLSLAAHVDRRGAMAALTGSIAHEISQPLSSILLNAEAAAMLVASDRATPEQLMELLRDIRSEDARATQIIQRHRTMLRKHDLQAQPVDLHGIVHESLALVAHESVRRLVRIDDEVSPAPCVVAGDEVLLQQVVINLVLNAMDAIADAPEARRRITVRSARRQGAVEISVADRGHGIPLELNGRLFEPFVTTKADGMGIGLSIARSTIEALSGTITARNNPEGGATFSFTLPRNAGT